MQRIGRLALIAEQVKEKESQDKFVSLLKSLMSVWIEGMSANRLVYDKAWGGIVSCGCKYDTIDGVGKCTNGGDSLSQHPKYCPTLSNVNFDFGNGYYNDHHFHYGYFIFAAAVLSHFDHSWAFTKISRPGFRVHPTRHDIVTAFIRDIANPSDQDEYFPKFRHKDWYVGFSWASGLTSSLDGRNQESSSEAVNAWYAISMYGNAIGDEYIETMGRVLMSTEIVSAQMYWQIPDGSEVYSPDLWPRKCVGVVWSNAVHFSTWFGKDPYLIHGIQMLPFSPASAALLPVEWLKQELPVYENSCRESDCAGSGWQALLVMAKAMVDPETAWVEGMSLSDSVYEGAAGDGMSRASLLHWIAIQQHLRTNLRERI